MARQSRVADLPPFLLTRPAAQADRFAQDLRARFGPATQIVVSPLLTPMFLRPCIPPGIAGVIFTSETGVAAFGQLCPTARLLAWCVGDRTAAAAQRAGHAARSAAGDADALVAAILAGAPPGLLLHARGADSRGAVAARLCAAGWPTVEAVVYAQMPLPLSAVAGTLLAGAKPVMVPLFSPRSATLLAGAMAQLCRRAPLWIVALSPAVAWASAPLNPARQATADSPDAAALLDAAERLIVACAQP